MNDFDCGTGTFLNQGREYDDVRALHFCEAIEWDIMNIIFFILYQVYQPWTYMLEDSVSPSRTCIP